MAKSSFMRHAAVYGAGELLVYAGGFLLLPLYVRTLAPQDFGAYDYLTRMGEIVLLCLLFKGLRQGMFSFHNLAKTAEERRAVVGSALFMTLLLLGGGGAAAALAAETLAQWLDAGGPGVLRLAILAVCLESFATLLLALAQARLQSVFFVAVSASQFFARVGLCILMVAVLGWGVEGIFIASAITSGVTAAYLLARELALEGVALSREQLRAMFWFALPFVPAGVGFFLLNSGDRLFLKQIVTDAELGAYALGYKLALVVKLFSRQPLYKVWSAQMYEAARQPDAPVLFGKVFTRILAVYAGVGLALCLAAGECIEVLAGSRYQAAAAIIPPVVLAYFFLTAADLMESGLYIQRKTSWKLPITTVSAVVMLGMYALLIPSNGIRGAALATLLGFVFIAILTGFTAQRFFPVRYEWGRVASVLALCVSCWLAGLVLPVELVMLPAKGLLWFGWLTAVWVTVLSDEEKQWARSLFGRSTPRGGSGALQNRAA